MSETALDVAALRGEFPVFSERTYLASHCLGPLPREAYGDLDDFRRSLSLRNRSIDEWVERMEEVRGLIGRVLSAPADSLAFASSATACQATLAAALRPSGARRRVLTTSLDFRSARYLWGAQVERGFEPVTIPSPDGVAMPSRALIDAIDERTAVVATSLVSYFNGAMIDLPAIVARARAAGALVIVDAYQAVGSMPIDVRALDVDALVGGTHKWLSGGGTGLAFAYVRPELAERLAPAFPGWLGTTEAASYPEAFTAARGARRFEQGTPPMEPIYTARAGLRFVLRTGVEALHARAMALGDRLIAGADARGIELCSPRSRAERGPMTCIADARSKETVLALRERGIDVDTRPGTGLRVSTHALNLEDEVDRFLDALVDVRRAS